MSEGQLRLGFVGDISMGDHPVCVGHGMRSAFQKKGHRILEQVAPTFRSFDLTVGNLETVCSEKGFVPKELTSYEMRGSPESLKCLKSAGIDVVGIANNHAMQHGLEAFWDTIEHLERNGLDIIGLDDQKGKTQEYWFEGGGYSENVLVGFSTRPEEWSKSGQPYSLRLDYEQLLDEIAALRTRCEGFLVCSIHWGLEFLTEVDPEIRELARKMVERGADVIVGHHPHVLQPFEYYGSGLIIYSLGNFTFDLWPEDTKHTVIAEILLSKGAKPEVIFHPVTINQDFTLSESDSATSRKTLNLLNSSMLLNDSLSSEEYKAKYRNARKTFRYSSYRYFLRNLFRYPLVFLYQSIFRTLGRRIRGE